MKFNWKRTFLCSLAFGWISLFWGAYDAILQTMDYGVFGLNEVWHGVIIAMDNILGLILLPLFGRLSDNARSKFGNRKPFVVIGTIISMIGFAGVCVFASLGKDYFVPYVICLMITLAAMAAYRSPALSIVPDLNPDKFRNAANAVSNVVSVILTVLAQLYYYVFMMFEGYYAIGAAIIVTTAPSKKTNSNLTPRSKTKRRKNRSNSKRNNANKTALWFPPRILRQSRRYPPPLPPLSKWNP